MKLHTRTLPTLAAVALPLFIVLALVPVTRAQTIPNPSFETDSFAMSPGDAADNGGGITGWTFSAPAFTGLNTASLNPFADNGAIPDGLNVAYIESVGTSNTLGTTLSGLVPGQLYQISFYANSCIEYSVPTAPSWSLNGGAFVPFTAWPPVGGNNPYYVNAGTFRATSSGAALVLANSTANDSTVLLDDFTIAAVNTPIVTTLPATVSVGAPVTLNGTVNPGGASLSAWFEYGPTTDYGFATSTNELAATNLTLSVGDLVTNLAPGTTCHYQLVAGDTLTSTPGGDLTFTIPITAPAITPQTAGTITLASATLNALVNPNGADTTVYYQYGLTTAYGYDTSTNTLDATNLFLSVSDAVGGLAPDTTYHYQLVAVNAAGSVTGPDQTFTTTLTGTPTVTTLPPSGVNQATLNGSVNPNGFATTAYYQYGPTTNYGDIGAFTSLAATNITLTLPPFSPVATTGPAGTNWFALTGAPNGEWSALAASADGKWLAGSTFSGNSYFYTSTNSGTTWTQQSFSAPGKLVSLASSADGTRLVAVGNGYLSTSTNGGVNWTEQSGAPAVNYQAVASSANGSQLVAGVDGGYLYTSTNSGVTWVAHTSPGTNDWTSVASSADGTRLVAVGDFAVCTSTNGGVNWTYQSGGPGATGANCQVVASSADGTCLVVGADPGYLYTSTNSGTTWTKQTGPGQASWSAVASSANGTCLVAGADSGFLYTSTNSGNSWSKASFRTLNCVALVSSADGTAFVAGNYAGYLYASTGISTNLNPGTPCHYQVLAINHAGTAIGTDLTFTPIAAPIVTNLAVSAVTATNATLAGQVNANAASTVAYYQYGTTTNYGAIGAYTSLAATNSLLPMPGLVMNAVALPGLGTWTRQTFAANYSEGSVLSSADGTRLVAENGTSQLYLSTNSGATWSQQPTGIPYLTYLAAASTDGTKLLALSGGNIYTSTNSGATWSLPTILVGETLSTGVSSADGTRLVVSGGSSTTGRWISNLYTSTNSGVTWAVQTNAPVIGNHSVMASSADGAKLLVGPGANSSGYLAISTNSGVTWTEQTNAPAGNWSAVASSADGTKLVAGESDGYLYTSTNSGVTWTQQTDGYFGNWNLLASSVDGTRLVGENSGTLYISTNSGSGVAWTAQTNAPGLYISGYGSSLAASADCLKLVMVSESYLSGFSTYSGVSTNLNPATKFHCQLVALNSAGRAASADLTFTTSNAAPAVTALAASAVTATSATLSGTVNPNGAVTKVFYQYGLTAAYGNYSTTNSLVATNLTFTEGIAIRNLTSGTTYHFQVVGVNSVGTSVGTDLTFTTLNLPVAFSLAGASSFSAGGFQLNFTNLTGLGFTVYRTTNLTLPLSSWTLLGAAVESPAGSGQYQFTDLQATNGGQNFYQITSP